jgi:hypothetical protein
VIASKSENETVAVVIGNGDIPVTILRFLLFVLQFKLYCFCTNDSISIYLLQKKKSGDYHCGIPNVVFIFIILVAEIRYC